MSEVAGIPVAAFNDNGELVTAISSTKDELNRPYVRADSRDEHDTTYFTTKWDTWTSVTGENVGTGNGTTTIFSLDNREVRSLHVYLDGAETTSFTLDSSTYSNGNEATHFCKGKITFTSAPANNVAITANYSYATIGNSSESLVFDFTQDTSPMIFNAQFCDPVHIKDGVVYYQNGALDSSMSVSVICPANNYYLHNNAGDYDYTTVDLVVAEYVIDQRMLGSAEMGIYFDVEARSNAIPPNYIIKFTVDKGSATSLKGLIRLECNRQRTIIL